MTCRTIAVGCLSIVGVAFGLAALFALTVWIQSSRLIARIPVQDPVPVDGDCPREAVVAWVDGSTEALVDHIMEPISEGTEAIEAQAPGSLEMAHVDVQTIRDRIAAAEEEAVPACLVGLRDEMLVLPRTMADAVAFVQDADHGPIAYRQAVLMSTIVRATRPSIDRVRDAKARLSERVGIDLVERDLRDEEPPIVR